MAKMTIAKVDRPKVKTECLRLLVTLKLNPAKTQLISKFVDIYLRLDVKEEQLFQAEIDTMDKIQKEVIMQTTTSWEEKGIEKGIVKRATIDCTESAEKRDVFRNDFRSH